MLRYRYDDWGSPTSNMKALTVALLTSRPKRSRALVHRASPTVVRGECCTTQKLCHIVTANSMPLID